MATSAFSAASPEPLQDAQDDYLHYCARPATTINVCVLPVAASIISCVACVRLLTLVLPRMRANKASGCRVERQLLHLTAADLGFHITHIIWWITPLLVGFSVTEDIGLETFFFCELSTFFKYAFGATSVFMEARIAIGMVLEAFSLTGRTLAVFSRGNYVVWLFGIASSFATVGCDLSSDEDPCTPKFRTTFAFTVCAGALMCCGSYILVGVSSGLMHRRGSFKKARTMIVLYPLNYLISFGPYVVLEATRRWLHRNVSTSEFLLSWTLAQLNGLLNVVTYMLQLRHWIDEMLCPCCCGDDEADANLFTHFSTVRSYNSDSDGDDETAES